MKKDILFPLVENIKIAVVKNREREDDDFWDVYIINDNEVEIHHIIVVSKGYSSAEDGLEKRKTSTLRHLINEVAPKSVALIESIDKQLFSLFNEFWVSYYIDRQIYDKKFIFVPDSINEKHFTFIPQLDSKGILHK